ncbi:MAG: glycoside hydrolase family 31 protein [Eubacteriales bacterium]|nr:glycoside hydrolase family 31 protein [Eubacteriales bacterium]
MDSTNLAAKAVSAPVKLNDGTRNLWLIPYAEDIVRIIFSGNERISDRESMIVTARADYSGWELIENEREIILRSSSLQVLVGRSKLNVSIFDNDNNLIYRESARSAKELESKEVIRTKTAAPDQLKMEVTVDGLRVRAQDIETYVDRMAAQYRLHFDFADDEALYGLGSHEEGVGNLRGTHQYVYQQNMKACVPVLISTRGYGLLFDSSCLMTFRDDFMGSYMWFEITDQLDYYFYAGNNLNKLNASYYKLTGTPPLLPRWSFGYVQSKERYVDAAEMIAVASEYRKRKIPLDCLVLDWRSWEGDLWGEKEFDRDRFPDPADLVNNLHQMDVRMMISIWPNMAPGGTNSAEMIENGYMLGNLSTYNAFDEQARATYWQQASKGLFSSGLDAWWCDCTEPFEGDWKGSIKPEPENRIAINCDEARRYLDPTMINAYSLQHSRGIYEGQRAETKDKRVVNLTRSSYAGQHRYATITWSGDTAASWDMFKTQITAATNFCVTGEPYWTMDIGAFFVGRKEQWFWSGQYDQGCMDPAYREFYLRMYQFGAFLPMFRSHGTDTPREIWRFGNPGEIIYDTLAAFTRLRYRLLPYIYSLAGQVTHEAGYIIAPPAMVFPQDILTHDLTDSFMLGQSILIRPITDPIHNSASVEATNSVSVYLPAGCDWFDFFSGEKYTGGQYVEMPVELERIPVFIRGGSILPLALAEQVEAAASTEDISLESYEIVVYRGADAEFSLYEDAGDGYDYEQGAYVVTQLSWNENKRNLTQRVHGDFPGFIADKKIKLKIIE